MTPPRLARCLLGATLPARDREDVLHDLDDLYALRVHRNGRRRARRWYWRQAVAVPVRLAVDTLGLRTIRLLRGWTADLVADGRIAWRSLRRRPGYAVPATLTLAAGVTATLTVSAIVDATVFRPLPYPDADRLVWLWPDGDASLSRRQVTALGESTRGTLTVTAVARREYTMHGGSMPVEVAGAEVSANHFDVFGLPPARGRAFRPDDAVPGATLVVLISYALWRDAFGADPDIVGRGVDLDMAAAIPMLPGAFTGTSRTVIGVLPPAYAPFGFGVDVMAPLVEDRADPNDAALRELTVVGRLAPGRTAAEAARALDDAVSASAAFPASERIPPAAPMPLPRALVGDRGTPLALSLTAALLVLALACANVIHLVLARLTARGHELTVRTALGAGRGRLVRQLFAESLVLCAVASLLGLGALWLGLPVVNGTLPATFDDVTVVVDGGTWLLLAGLTVVLTLGVGAGPALLHTSRLGRDLHAHRATGEGAGGSRLPSQVLIAAEVTLAIVLVVSAGLLARSLGRLVAVDPGFRASGVVTVRFSPSEARFSDVNLRRQTIDEILARTRRLPGVQSAAAIHFLPVADEGPGVMVRGADDPAGLRPVSYRVVTPGYFDTMRIPLAQGRSIAPSDDASAPPVAVVNERMAAQFWPDGQAVGRQLFRSNGSSWTVVGVVGDVRQETLRRPAAAEFYLPMAQSDWANAMTVVARTEGGVAATGQAIARTIRDVAPQVPVTRVAALDQVLATSVDEPRFYSRLFATFGALALALGLVGVYGVAAFLVGRRRRAIGICLALGATPMQILRREMRVAGRAVGLGLLLGLAGAVVAGRGLRALLFDVSVLDPVPIGAAVLLLGITATLAVLLPVRRATRANPLHVLRE